MIAYPEFYIGNVGSLLKPCTAYFAIWKEGFEIPKPGELTTEEIDNFEVFMKLIMKSIRYTQQEKEYFFPMYLYRRSIPDTLVASTSMRIGYITDTKTNGTTTNVTLDDSQQFLGFILFPIYHDNLQKTLVRLSAMSIKNGTSPDMIYSSKVMNKLHPVDLEPKMFDTDLTLNFKLVADVIKGFCIDLLLNKSDLKDISHFNNILIFDE